MKILTENIIKARKAIKLSQGKLAKQIGVSQPTVNNIENGINKTIHADVLPKMARVLGLKENEIVILDGEEGKGADIYSIQLPLNTETFRLFKQALKNSHEAINLTNEDNDPMPIEDKDIELLARVYLGSLFDAFGYSILDVKRELKEIVGTLKADD